MKNILVLIIGALLLTSCKDERETNETIVAKYFKARSSFDYKGLKSLINDTLIITEGDYIMTYSKEEYYEVFKWDSIFQTNYELVELKEADNKVLVSVDLSSIRNTFLENDSMICQYAISFESNKISKIESLECKNADWKLWQQKVNSLVAWVDENHPELNGFIHDMSMNGANNYIQAIQLYEANNTSLDFPNSKTTVEHEKFILKKPTSRILGTLILFGGFPERPKDIMREFEIDSVANQNGIAIIYSNFNRRLWLDEEEKKELKIILEEAFETNNIPKENIYIGGFSSGGNVSLLLSNYLMTQNSTVKPNGLFIIDSPVDLLELYYCSQRNIEKSFMEGSVLESEKIINRLNEEIGNPKNGIDSFEIRSPYTFRTRNIDNLNALKNLKLRFYTEPDSIWWKVNRRNDYTDMNAYYIKALAQDLENQFKNSKVKLIETSNKGYRNNGLRHPHSWSIVDKQELMHWILN